MVMNDFDSSLSAVLEAEADRTTLTLNTQDAAHRLEARLDQIDRHRRHRTLSSVLAAAAAVLVAGGVYGVMSIDSPRPAVPPPPPPKTTPTSYLDHDGAGMEPGTYRMWVGLANNGLAIDADLTLQGAAWQSYHDPVLGDTDGNHGSVAAYQPTALATGNGCLSDRPNTNVGQTPKRLAQQLAQLPQSTLVQTPSPRQAFGRDAIHLRLRINNDCGNGGYRVAEATRGSEVISYADKAQGVVIDFWVLKVGGVPVVVDTWHDDGASSQLVRQIAGTRKSITFVTRDPAR
jgi:hypothetical protein